MARTTGCMSTKEPERHECAHEPEAERLLCWPLHVHVHVLSFANVRLNDIPRDAPAPLGALTHHP
jgi:hypothetical protein